LIVLVPIRANRKSVGEKREREKGRAERGKRQSRGRPVGSLAVVLFRPKTNAPAL
jgi:hypothetical protein